MFSTLMKFIRRLTAPRDATSDPAGRERAGKSTVLRRSYDAASASSAADQAVATLTELAAQAGGIEQLRIEISVDSGGHGSLFAETIARRLALSEDDQFRVTRHSGRGGRFELIVERLHMQQQRPARIQPALVAAAVAYPMDDDKPEPSPLQGFYFHLAAQLRAPLRKAIDAMPRGQVLGIDEIVIVSEDEIEAAVRRVAAERPDDLPLAQPSVAGDWLAEKLAGVVDADTLTRYPAFASVTLARTVRLVFERKAPALRGSTPDSAEAADDGLGAFAPLPSVLRFACRLQTRLSGTLGATPEAVLLVPRHRITLIPTGLACEPIESPAILAHGDSVVVGRGWDHANEREQVLRSCAGKPLIILRTKKSSFPSQLQIEIRSGEHMSVSQISANVPTQVRGIVLQPGQRGTCVVNDGDHMLFGRNEPYLKVQVRIEAVREVGQCYVTLSKTA